MSNITLRPWAVLTAFLLGLAIGGMTVGLLVGWAV